MSENWTGDFFIVTEPNGQQWVGGTASAGGASAGHIIQHFRASGPLDPLGPRLIKVDDPAVWMDEKRKEGYEFTPE